MSQQKPPKKNNFKNAALLSGIAFEMGAIIFLAVKGGNWLDNTYEMQKPVYTLLCTLFGLVISIYIVIQQLKRIKQ